MKKYPSVHIREVGGSSPSSPTRKRSIYLAFAAAAQFRGTGRCTPVCNPFLRRDCRCGNIPSPGGRPSPSPPPDSTDSISIVLSRRTGRVGRAIGVKALYPNSFTQKHWYLRDFPVLLPVREDRLSRRRVPAETRASLEYALHRAWSHLLPGALACKECTDVDRELLLRSSPLYLHRLSWAASSNRTRNNARGLT